jgi:Leucine-rich repeat (LRR) protein
LSKLKKLENLNLTGTELTDLSVVPQFKFYEYTSLFLSDTNVTDLSPLKGKSFYSLFLRNTKIKDFSPLANIYVSETLDLSGNEIADLEFFANLKFGLESLKLNSTNVSDLTPLGSFAYLDYLEIENTNVSDEELEKFKKLRPDCNVYRGDE